MSKDLNKVMITGRLGADPEMRFTPQGSPVTTFNVASGRTWRSADGTQHDDTEWFRVVAWDKLAEICNQYLTKGARVYVEGRLQTRKYQDREGVNRQSTEVIATDMIILSSRREDDANGYAGASFDEMGAAPARASAPIPAPNRAPSAPRSNAPQPISDDEFDAPPPVARPARPASNSRPKSPPPQMDDDAEDLPF
jgi:single-strand DNA-binding protein